MAHTRRVMTVDGEGSVSLDEEPAPDPAPGEVLVSVEASLVTPGTGATPVRGRREDPDPDRESLKRGYQAAGRIAELGTGVEQFSIDDRVACMGSGYAYQADVVCVPLPDGVSYEAGCLQPPRGDGTPRGASG